jgi:K+-transporting ATPase KdpF subunit
MDAKIMLAYGTVQSDTALSNDTVSYLIGGVIALLILAYLIYTLLRPEKF